MQKLEKHDHRVEHIFRRILHTPERLIAALTILVMVAALGVEIYHLVTTTSAVTDTGRFLVRRSELEEKWWKWNKITALGSLHSPRR